MSASDEDVESLRAEVAQLRAQLDARRDSPWALTPAGQSIADLSPDNILVLDLDAVVERVRAAIDRA